MVNCRATSEAFYRANSVEFDYEIFWLVVREGRSGTDAKFRNIEYRCHGVNMDQSNVLRPFPVKKISVLVTGKSEASFEKPTDE